MRWEVAAAALSLFTARYTEPLVLGLPLALDGTFQQELFDTLYTRTRGRLGGRWALSRAGSIEAGVDFSRRAGAARRAPGPTPRARGSRSHPTGSTTASPRARAGAARRGRARRSRARSCAPARAPRDRAPSRARSCACQTGSRSAVALELRGAGRLSERRARPLYDRYALGGAASLRGYDEEAFHVDRYALSRAEWRWFLPARQYAFVFWDHAAMATRLPDLDGARLQVLGRDGYGVGLALGTSSGRLGLMYGLAPGRSPMMGEDHLRLVSPF